MSDSVKRTLIVTGQKPITQVQTGAGGKSTLYEVFATDPDGNPIEEQLRTFAELEEGVPVEYEVQRYNHEQYGTSFTLFPPKRETHKRVSVLERDFQALKDELKTLKMWAESQGFDPNKMASVPAPEDPEADERWGETAPWEGEDLELKPSEEENG